MYFGFYFFHLIQGSLLINCAGSIQVHMGIYDLTGAFLAGPTTVRVPYRVSIGDIQDKAQNRFPSMLKDVDVGDVKVYQLKKEHELKLGERIELTQMATKLNFRSQIQNDACLACVIPGSLFIYYCNNLHAMMVFLYDISS